MRPFMGVLVRFFSGEFMIVVVMIMPLREPDLKNMRVPAVRNADLGLELMGFRQMGQGFQIFPARLEREHFAGAVRPAGFQRDQFVRVWLPRFGVAIEEIKPEARRHARFKHADFQKPVPRINHRPPMRTVVMPMVMAMPVVVTMPMIVPALRPLLPPDAGEHPCRHANDDHTRSQLKPRLQPLTSNFPEKCSPIAASTQMIKVWENAADNPSNTACVTVPRMEMMKAAIIVLL